MSDFAAIVKEKLDTIIRKMSEKPEAFVKKPGIDFTRKRCLPFESVIKLMLSMGGNSLRHELLDYFDYSLETVSVSAFVQQRNKILPSAFEYLLGEFNRSFKNHKTYEGYRLLAADGTDVNIAYNPDDIGTYRHSGANRKGYNQLHINALYDLLGKQYLDALVQPGRNFNEYSALADMVDRASLSEPTILIADRGFESYNIFAHIEQKGWNYLIRVKDRQSKCMLSTMRLPDTDEFDTTINLTLTRKYTSEVKVHPETYKFLQHNSRFDFLDLDENCFYPISFRVIRFPISTDTYETIITNLPAADFSADKIKFLYHLRWGIETSFRELKYAVGLVAFHSKTVAHITQEIFARLIMYNFCEMITLHVVVSQKQTKHVYQVNFTAAIQICVLFFRSPDSIRHSDIEAHILKYILPSRQNRSAKRNLRPKSTVSFSYRIA